jgi:hypothetical protein
MTPSELQRFVASCKLGVLSTIGPTGAPQSALVGIAVTPGLEIVFDTVKTSRKYPNLCTATACSFVIGWEGEQTVQYEGQARELSGAERGYYLDIYFHTWPDGPGRLKWPGIVHFAVTPTWIRYSDFDVRPPFIIEFTRDQLKGIERDHE